jgi:hypothetical protein
MTLIFRILISSFFCSKLFAALFWRVIELEVFGKQSSSRRLSGIRAGALGRLEFADPVTDFGWAADVNVSAGSMAAWTDMGMHRQEGSEKARS